MSEQTPDSDLTSTLSALAPDVDMVSSRELFQRERARGRRRRWYVTPAAAAVIAVGVVGLWLLAARDPATTVPGVEATPPTASPTETASTPEAASATTTVPITETTSGTTPPTEMSTTPPSSLPADAPPLVRTWESLSGAIDVTWESARIPRTCGEVWWTQQQTTQVRCTQLAIGPDGVPITYDPVTRTVARHDRDGGTSSFELPNDYVDPTLIAVGPDDVAYFSLDNEWPKSSDVVAVSMAPGDAGSVLERFPEAMGIGDADLFATAEGLVLSGWYEQGPRPAVETVPFVRWVRRAGGTAEYPGYPSSARFDDAEGVVWASNWSWPLGDRLVVPDSPGNGRVVATHDGGFLALYTEHTGDLRAELMRGYRDGRVEHWLLPGSWYDIGIPVLEPQGSVLVPDGDRFVRVRPFETDAEIGWDGGLEIDADAGTAEAIALNEFVDEYIRSLASSGDGTLPWDLGPIAFADAVAGPLSSPAELRTIVAQPTESGGFTVTVTTEGYLDDSVFGTRLTVHLVFEEWLRLGRIDWAQTCQPGRGHQDYQAAWCV